MTAEFLPLALYEMMAKILEPYINR